jgi:hypothetical protein
MMIAKRKEKRMIRRRRRLRIGRNWIASTFVVLDIRVARKRYRTSFSALHCCCALACGSKEGIFS